MHQAARSKSRPLFICTISSISHMHQDLECRGARWFRSRLTVRREVAQRESGSTGSLAHDLVRVPARMKSYRACGKTGTRATLAAAPVYPCQMEERTDRRMIKVPNPHPVLRLSAPLESLHLCPKIPSIERWMSRSRPTAHREAAQ